jgi:hypothetical protein
LGFALAVPFSERGGDLIPASDRGGESDGGRDGLGYPMKGKLEFTPPAQ